MREAHDWVVRLTSGEATAADAEALRRWRAASSEHRRAFAEANLVWDRMHIAATESLVRKAVARAPRAQRTWHLPSRGTFLAGAAAGSAAAAAAYAVVRPPFDLWPSLSEVTADYRTGVGQQRQFAIVDDVSLKLNTRTSIALLPRADAGRGADRIELIA